MKQFAKRCHRLSHQRTQELAVKLQPEMQFAVGSVAGIGGMAGAVGGMLIALAVGEILQRTGSYAPIFIIAGSAYPVALTVIHLLAPKIQPAKV
jgi:nitrate/nitrite transporter NarK